MAVTEDKATTTLEKSAQQYFAQLLLPVPVTPVEKSAFRDAIQNYISAMHLDIPVGQAFTVLDTGLQSVRKEIWSDIEGALTATLQDWSHQYGVEGTFGKMNTAVSAVAEEGVPS